MQPQPSDNSPSDQANRQPEPASAASGCQALPDATIAADTDYSRINQQLCEEAAGCWFLTGATASGKTSVSVEMAKMLDAEIISLDSMAIYRGMNIGTAKPAVEIRQQVPHHLIDIVDPDQTFSVSQYRDRAMETIRQIRQRGKSVLFVGGTALYLKALLRGIFQGPPADWELRKEIEAELAEMGSEFLHQRLTMLDPVSADLLHPNDHRRIIRALEVFRATGKPISHWQLEFDYVRDPLKCRVFTMRHPRPRLHQRIEQRVEAMFQSGLVTEVEELLGRYQQLGQTASQAVGYQEVMAYLDGQRSLPETIEKVKSRTRKFARHQETWFRGMQECRLIDLDDSFDPTHLAAQLVENGNNLSN